MYSIVTDSVNGGYQKAIDLILKEGKEISPRGQKTKELLTFCWEITNPRKRSCEAIGRWKNLGFQLAEFLWIFNGKEDLETMEHYVPTYGNFSDDGVILHGAYGPRLRNFNGVDQIQTTYEKLMKDPSTRQGTMTIWNPELDNKETKDVCCTNLFKLNIRDGKLNWTTFMRSNDILWGTIYNVFNFCTMQEVMAGWLGVEVGKYVHIVDCVHIYSGRLDVVKRMISQEKKSIDIYDYFPPQDARLPKFMSDIVILNLNRLLTALRLQIHSRQSREHEEYLISLLPEGYWRNYGLTLLCYEDIRRGNIWEAINILPRITNEFMPGLAQRICRTLYRTGVDPKEKLMGDRNIWKAIKHLPKEVTDFILENPLKEVVEDIVSQH